MKQVAMSMMICSCLVLVAHATHAAEESSSGSTPQSPDETHQFTDQVSEQDLERATLLMAVAKDGNVGLTDARILGVIPPEVAGFSWPSPGSVQDSAGYGSKDRVTIDLEGFPCLNLNWEALTSETATDEN